MNDTPDVQARLVRAGLEPVGDELVDELAAALVEPGADAEAKQSAMTRAALTRNERPLANLLAAIRVAAANRAVNISSVGDRIADLGLDPSHEQIAAHLGIEVYVLESSPTMFAATLATLDLLAGRDLDEAVRLALHDELGILPGTTPAPHHHG